jgi:hypothetical protein
LGFERSTGWHGRTTRRSRRSSKVKGLAKVGIAEDAAARLSVLNTERYGGTADWQLVRACKRADAGRVEIDVHMGAGGLAAQGLTYRNGTACTEIYREPAKVLAIFDGRVA